MPGKHINYNHKAETPHKLLALPPLLIRMHKSCRARGPSVRPSVVVVVFVVDRIHYKGVYVVAVVVGRQPKNSLVSRQPVRSRVIRGEWSRFTPTESLIKKKIDNQEQYKCKTKINIILLR